MQHIDHDGPEAPYLQLADILRGQIERGDVAPSARLPSVLALSRDYGIAPVTARKALRVLVDEGLATVSPGRGTFVARKRDG